MEVVRRLGARPDGEFAVGVHPREGGVLLNRQMGAALEEEGVFEDLGGLGETLFHVAELECDLLVDVSLVGVVVDLGLGVGEGLLGREDGLQGLVVDLDGHGGFERRILVDGRHRGDWVADEPDPVNAEGMLVLGHGQDAEGRRQRLAGQDRDDPGQFLRRRGVDRDDRRVGHMAAVELSEEHPRERQVVGEFGDPGRLCHAVDFPRGTADLAEGFVTGHGRPHRGAPRPRARRPRKS